MAPDDKESFTTGQRSLKAANEKPFHVKDTMKANNTGIRMREIVPATSAIFSSWPKATKIGVVKKNRVGLIQQDSFQRLLHKQDGTRAEWEYPFAVAGINISFMLIQMLDLQSGKPSSSAGIRFLELLEKDEMAFDNLYCVAFQMMDAQWLAKRASYMEFNDVLKSTRAQLERELKLEDISCVQDLPAYNLLHR
ncbi:uncharacterized protein LOC18044330 [Citrus clementina]|nr:uncharacterized protein LOC18044330 [Citrus x clementina]